MIIDAIFRHILHRRTIAKSTTLIQKVNLFTLYRKHTQRM